MAGRGATLALKITGDVHDGVRALDDVEGKAGRLDGVFGKMGLGIAAGVAVGGAALLKLGTDSFQAASDLQQSTGAIDSVFGDWAVDIEQSAQKADMALGLSTSAYENLASVIGAQLHGAGMAHDEMTSKTQALISKGADLAATFGGTTAEAVEALSSVLKGETDPIERYGVSIKQSDISARLAAEGNDKLTGTALKTATANAALALVNEQTASSTGAFAKESDTAAGAQERLGAKFENIKATLGEKLLPIFTTVASFILDKVIPYFEKLTEKGGPLNDMFSKVSTFIKDQVIPVAKDLWQMFQDKVVPIFDDVSRVIKEIVVPAFEKIWGYVKDYVIPIFKTTLSPVIDGVRDVIHKLSDKIIENKDKFQEIWDKIKPFIDFMRDKVAPIVGDVVGGAFKLLGTLIDPVVDTITWILDKAADVIGFVGKIGDFLFGGDSGGSGGGAAKRSAPMVGAARGAAPLRTAASMSPSGAGVGPTGAAGFPLLAAGGDTYNITINGVLNADDAAEQIRRLLERADRMAGLTVAGAFT